MCYRLRLIHPGNYGVVTKWFTIWAIIGKRYSEICYLSHSRPYNCGYLNPIQNNYGLSSWLLTAWHFGNGWTWWHLNNLITVICVCPLKFRSVLRNYYTQNFVGREIWKRMRWCPELRTVHEMVVQYFSIRVAQIRPDDNGDKNK